MNVIGTLHRIRLQVMALYDTSEAFVKLVADQTVDTHHLRLEVFVDGGYYPFDFEEADMDRADVVVEFVMQRMYQELMDA